MLEYMKKSIIFMTFIALTLNITGCGNISSSKENAETQVVETQTETETTVLTNRDRADIYDEAIKNSQYYMEGQKYYSEMSKNNFMTFNLFKDGCNGDDYIGSNRFEREQLHQQA